MRRDRHEQERLVREWRRSGLTAARFGEQHGLSAQQLHNWSWRFGSQRSERKSTPTEALRLLRVELSASQQRATGRADAQNSVATATLELMTDGRVKVSFPLTADLRALAALIATLRGSSC
jgi:hypothetical protein